ncbi:wax ester/triacylglycerol synthase family O-acyltransferase [Mycolicibacterium sp. 120270]|uniref:wax ester/triacylglycerol synthase family O-acyltransferase n=1 Tax=Mycolicibacterium sp. 120270 TaxID=3090600 RepID=UPI00299CF177|nr:wax ester/triacylglycerol synthase family O-acyltransferase [Mycolicibacterium sp. 120270]MDX1886128.1 wax ester/triacylglycerol synthase family O-acyltransferase [Mycolicibacterium sp. 120270]
MKRFAPPEAVVMLMLETTNYPMHIGGMQVFRPPAGAGPDFAHQVYEAMRSHTAVDKKWAGHPSRNRFGRSIVRWEYEDEVDLDYHLRYTTVSPPGGEREVLDLISDLHAKPLNRDRPLWEVHVIDGLADGRFATYIKGHHALADGVSGARMSQQVLSPDPHDDTVRVAWSPRSRHASAPGATRKQVVGPLKFYAQLAKSFPVIRQALRDRELLPWMRAPRTLLNVGSGTSRRCRVMSFPVERITKVASVSGVSFNDVALAMTSGALRDYLSGHNALPDAPLVAWVPVNIRGDEDALGDNIIGAALCNLATHVDDSANRLEIIHASMKHNIKLVRELPKNVALNLSGVLVLPLSGQRGLRARIPPTFNVTISYVRGQDAPLYRKGALLEDFYGFLPTLRGNALNIVLFATSEHLDFGFAACAQAVPDLDVLTGNLETALSDLERSAGL